MCIPSHKRKKQLPIFLEMACLLPSLGRGAPALVEAYLVRPGLTRPYALANRQRNLQVTSLVSKWHTFLTRIET